MTTADEIAQLRKELAEIKASIAPTPVDPEAGKKWASEMHALAEKRASQMGGFSHDDLRAMEQACPTSVMRNIVADNRAPVGRPGVIPQSTTTPNVSRPVNTSGWREAAPLSNPPGVAIADKLMDEADRRDRLQLLAEDARRQALMKAAEKK